MLAWPVIRELMAIRQRLEDCLDDSSIIVGGQVQPADGTLRPAADLFEDENHLIIVMEVPGIEADAIELSIQENRLRIAGASLESANEADRGDYLRMERSDGGFSREFHLPDIPLSGDPEGALEDGVLIVKLPKAPSARHRRIEITGEDA